MSWVEGAKRAAIAKALEEIAKVDAVVNLSVPDDIIVARLSARLQCKTCREIYNERTLRPKVPGKCDKCGGGLFRRADDQPEVIRERLRVYRESSEPVIEFYSAKGLLRNIQSYDANADPDNVVQQILQLIS